MIPRPHLLKSCKRPIRGDGRSLWSSIPPPPRNRQEFWSLLMHWQVDPPSSQLVNPTTDLVWFFSRGLPLLLIEMFPQPSREPDEDTILLRPPSLKLCPCCGWPHVTASPPATSPTLMEFLGYNTIIDKNGMDAEGHAQILWSISALFYFSFSQA